MSTRIELTNGGFTLIDDEDYDEVMKFKWFGSNDGPRRYVRRTLGGMRLTEFLTGIKGIDHIDGNGENNQRSNLREATLLQNNANRRKLTKGSSKYKGVCYVYGKGKDWRAYIRVQTKRIHLGYFDNEEDAARAYDKAAKEHFGEFANTNF